MIAIALPMMLLLACGGGGSSTATRTPATIPPTTDGPNMPPAGTGDPMTPPPTTGDPNMPPTVILPGYAITDTVVARMEVGGTEPTTSMSEQQIVSAIQTRATVADTFEFSDFIGGTADVDITCSDTNKSCTGTVPDVNMLTFSLNGIEDLSLVDGDMNLVGFDSDTEAVMVDAGVTMIQSQAAAAQNDGTHLTFQTYGGWLTNSVFGLEILGVTENDTTTNRFASFSFGNDSGSNPSFGLAAVLGTVLQWSGVMVGTNTETGHVVHGDASIQYINADANVLDGVIFSNVTNLSDGSSVTFGAANRLQFSNIPLSNGAFESAGGDIKGSFYGTSHEEIGGIFNSSTHNIIGAFGGTKN